MVPMTGQGIFFLILSRLLSSVTCVALGARRCILRLVEQTKKCTESLIRVTMKRFDFKITPMRLVPRRNNYIEMSERDKGIFFVSIFVFSFNDLFLYSIYISISLFLITVQASADSASGLSRVTWRGGRSIRSSVSRPLDSRSPHRTASSSRTLAAI